MCKKPLLRNGNAKEGVYWFEHETPIPYGPVVHVFEDDWASIEPKKLMDIFVLFHKQLKDVRQPPGEIVSGVGGPITEVPHDPNYKYDE